MPRQPNILLFVTDDQRATGTLEVMDTTRRLFAREGSRFTSAYVTTPLCAPSRASIFTGQYAHNHGVTGNSQGAVLDHDSTFQRVLDGAGYRTALFGKFVNKRRRDEPVEHFDRSFLGFNAAHDWHDRDQDPFIARKAVRFIEAQERRDRRPWLVVVAFHSPHVPLVPRRRHARAPVPGRSETPAVGERDISDKEPDLANVRVGDREARRIAIRQQRMLLAVDAAVGSVVDATTAAGERNTLSIFTSDNGYLWGEHSLKGKNVPYLDAVRVPLLLRWPGRIDAGSPDPRIAANVDLAPTILDAAGLEAGHTIDGHSLLGDRSRPWLLFEGTSAEGSAQPVWEHALLDSTTHFISWESGFEEFYDLGDDPWELEGGAGTPSERREVRSRIASASDCSGESCP